MAPKPTDQLLWNATADEHLHAADNSAVAMGHSAGRAPPEVPPEPGLHACLLVVGAEKTVAGMQ